ncbi:MAG: Gfo/Idh/MocA family oxidoreductase [Chloroflexota bacterium]|nr:Gfo/Idh/MocA family oxidoreductase [Chloroflexota bacterium]
MSKIRWGLLSTANINKCLIPAIRASRRGELVAVASRNKEKAETYARKWEIAQAFGDYQEMLDSGAVDAVYVSLPNHLHAEWSIRAMQAGVHVLCEKPFAITLMEVDAMIAASRESGCKLAEAFMYRHHPQTKIAGEFVKSGKLGEITLVRGAFDFCMHADQRQPDNLNVRLVPKYGGGCLWDVGVYPLSFTQFIMGTPPERVLGTQWLGDSGVDEVFGGQMCYPQQPLSSEEHDCAIAQISASFRTPFHTFIEIVGTEGRLHLTRPFANMGKEREMVFYPQKVKAQKVRVPKKKLYLGEVEDMHAAILDDAPNYISLEESRNHIRTVLALYESARKGEPVRLL